MAWKYLALGEGKQGVAVGGGKAGVDLSLVDDVANHERGSLPHPVLDHEGHDAAPSGVEGLSSALYKGYPPKKQKKHSPV